MIKQLKYLLLLAAGTIFIASCKEDVHVEEPAKPLPPVVSSFAPTEGQPGTQIEIYGENFASVDSVYISNKLTGELTPIKLVSRITDKLIVAEIVPGVPSDGYVVVQNPQGKRQSTETFFTTYTTPSITSVPGTAMVNNIVVLKGVNLKAITKVYFGADINTKEEAPFSFQYADSVGVLVPLLSNASAKIFYYYSSTSGDQHKTYGSNVAITYPTVAINNISAVVPGQTVTIEGENLNMVTTVTLGTYSLKVYPYSKGIFALQAKVPVDVPQGTYTLVASTIQGAGHEVSKNNINSQPAPAPINITTCNFEDYVLESPAFNKTIKSGAAQYPIYDIPLLINKVVTNYDTIRAPEGNQFGRLYVPYNDTVVTGGDPVKNASAKLGGSTFADVIFFPKSVANTVRENVADPILHFSLNTNGKYLENKDKTAIVSPVLIIVVTAATGETFPNGATSCMFRLTSWVSPRSTSWHQYAVQLTEISAWEKGNSADKDLTPDNKKWGIGKAILDGKVGEIKLQVRGAGTSSSSNNYQKYEIEVDVDNFFISNTVTPGAIDLTSNLQQ